MLQLHTFKSKSFVNKDNIQILMKYCVSLDVDIYYYFLIVSAEDKNVRFNIHAHFLKKSALSNSVYYVFNSNTKICLVRKGTVMYH